MSIEAMKLALDFFEKTSNCLPIRYDKEGLAVHTALRQAIEQEQKQEPVATLDELEQEIYENTRQFVSRDVMEWMLKRYYTSPPPRQPLTSKQIREWWASENGFEDCNMARLDDFEQVVRAVEGKHGIKGEA